MPNSSMVDEHHNFRGEHYGIHRVLEPRGALPQAAMGLDPQTEHIRPSELVIDVELLNVDSASFRELESRGRDEAALRTAILDIVAQRGKLQNPVTGSGGMLLGRVSPKSGPAALSQFQVQAGERVATLVSLTLTPLRLDRLGKIDAATHQIEASGEAIVFASGMVAALPSDLPERLVVAALDVAGAAPQVDRWVRAAPRSPARVLILGCGGKSGLIAAATSSRLGAEIIGVEASQAAASRAKRLGAFERVLTLDARDPMLVASQTGGEFDCVISCVNVEGAEMAAILATRQGGVVYFFGMATRFAHAALGAEGVCRDVTLLIGNGYTPGHVDTTLGLLRTDTKLRAIFEEQFCG